MMLLSPTRACSLLSWSGITLQCLLFLHSAALRARGFAPLNSSELLENNTCTEGNMHITSVAVSIETMLLTEVPVGFLSVAILLAPHFSSAFCQLSDPTNKVWLGNYWSNPDFVSLDIIRVHRTNSAMAPNEEWCQQRQKCTFVCVCTNCSD